MSTVNWVKGLVIEQDPQAVRDYAIDFETMLEGDTLSSATIAFANCTAVLSNFTATVVNVRVSEVEVDASVTLTIVTSTGQEDQRTVEFTPVNM